jgi:hypothetical protein
VKHVEPARLFAFVRSELGEAEAQQVREHLGACHECGEAFTRVLSAQSLFVAPPVPKLSEKRWEAIDLRVMEAAAREMSRPSLWRRLRSLWDAPLFKPALSFAVTAAVALFVVFVGLRQREPLPELPGPLASVNADVTFTVGSDLAPGQSLKPGAKIVTKKEGEIWLKIGGSKLAVLGESDATLKELSLQSVKVALDQGALVIAAEYQTERALEVIAGRLTVRSVGAVGTRFLVMKDGPKSGVAVEEGSVEAEYEGKKITVPAGRSFSLSAGGSEDQKLDEPDQKQVRELVKPPAPRRPRPPRVAMVAVPDAALPIDEGPEADEPEPAAPVAPPARGTASDWVALPPQPEPKPVAAAPEPSPRVTGAAPDDAKAPEESNWFKRQLKKHQTRWMQRHCRELEKDIEHVRTQWPVGNPHQAVVLQFLLKDQAKCREVFPDGVGR